MASHEIGSSDQIGRTDRTIAETQVRSREPARFLGVVCEIGLAIFVSCRTNDLDGVFIGTDCTIRTQTVKLGFVDIICRNFDLRKQGKRGKGHVIHDTDGELSFWFLHLHIFVNGDDL